MASDAADPTTDLSPLLSEPFAQAWAADALPPPPALRGRLSGRLERSLAAEQGLVTVRQRRLVAESAGDGVSVSWLYRAPGGRELRPGEPVCAYQLDLASGARVDLASLRCGTGALECLVIRGDARCAGADLAGLDFLRLPAGADSQVTSAGGARLFVRESPATEGVPVGAKAAVVRDGEASWPEYGPGVWRRVLWSEGGQAAMLYRTEPGAFVPHHSHGHDEECLMVEGEIFLDDVLLQRGDYQLAPAGSDHRTTETDTGVVLFVHGDLDLAFV